MRLGSFGRRRASAVFAAVLATASIAGLTIGATPASAAVFTVTTTTDGGAGSLREAVETLAVNAGGDEVVLQAGATYTLTCAQGGALAHANTPLTITGNGATITMEAACEEHILDNGSGALVLNGVRVAGLNLSVAGIDGGVLETEGTLALESVVVNDVVVNSSDSVFAGLFETGGATTAVGTTITNVSISTTSDNSVFGGITNNNGASFTDSVISDISISTEDGSVFGGLFDNDGATLVRTAIARVTVTTGDGSIFGGIVDNGGLAMTDSTISDVSVTSDTATIFGGVSCNDGLTMVRSHITGVTTRTAGTIFGGVVDNDGLTMTDSSITDVSATTTGTGDLYGGIGVSGAELVRSTIADVTVDAAGNLNGGLFNVEGSVSLTNSTVANVSAQADDTFNGGLFYVLSLTVVYTTMDGFSSDSLPAITDLDLTAFGSVFGSGVTCDDDVTTTSQGYNFATNTSCALLQSTDKQGDTLNPLLGALADNGGPGPTLLPLTGSPLIDAIPAAACQSGGATGITTDERGLPRPSATSPNCDIGAVEVQPAPAPPPVVVTPTFTG